MTGGSSNWGPNNGEATDRDVPINSGQQQLIEESVAQLQELAGAPPAGLSEQSLNDIDSITQELQIGNDPENVRRIEANVHVQNNAYQIRKALTVKPQITSVVSVNRQGHSSQGAQCSPAHEVD